MLTTVTLTPVAMQLAADVIQEAGSYPANTKFPDNFIRYGGSSRAAEPQFVIAQGGTMYRPVVPKPRSNFKFSLQTYAVTDTENQGRMNTHSDRFLGWSLLNDDEMNERWSQAARDKAIAEVAHLHGSDYQVHRRTEGAVEELYLTFTNARWVPPKPTIAFSDDYLQWAHSPIQIPGTGDALINGVRPGEDPVNYPDSALGLPVRIGNVDEFFGSTPGATARASAFPYEVIIERLSNHFSTDQRLAFGGWARAFDPAILDQLADRVINPSLVTANRGMWNAERERLDQKPELGEPLPAIETMIW